MSLVEEGRGQLPRKDCGRTTGNSLVGKEVHELRMHHRHRTESDSNGDRQVAAGKEEQSVLNKGERVGQPDSLNERVQDRPVASSQRSSSKFAGRRISFPSVQGGLSVVLVVDCDIRRYVSLISPMEACQR